MDRDTNKARKPERRAREGERGTKEAEEGGSEGHSDVKVGTETGEVIREAGVQGSR